MKTPTFFKSLARVWSAVAVAAVSVLALLQGCGGSGGDTPPAPTTGPDVTLGIATKQLQFSWAAVPNATLNVLCCMTSAPGR